MKDLRWIPLLCALLLLVSACAPFSTQEPNEKNDTDLSDGAKDDALWDIPIPKDIYPLSIDHLLESELPVVRVSLGCKDRGYGSVYYTYCEGCIHIFQLYPTMDVREYFFCPYEGGYRGYMREYLEMGEKSEFEVWREFGNKREVETFVLSHIDGDFPSYGVLLGVDADAEYQGHYEYFVQEGEQPEDYYTLQGDLYSLETEDDRTLLLLAERETGVLFGVISIQSGVQVGLPDDWEIWSDAQIYQHFKRVSNLKVYENREMTVNYLKDWDSWVKELSRP